MKTTAMRKGINWLIALLSMGIALLLAFGTDAGGLWIFAVMVFSIFHGALALRKGESSAETSGNRVAYRDVLPSTALTELVLLGEDGGRLASWNIYGKNGIVIGRDVGENHVTVNLDSSAYASMIDIEHAVLNYSGDSWYIEDISEKNGVSIQKQDGKKYKLAYGKPCRLEKGDIICIALARLRIS